VPDIIGVTAHWQRQPGITATDIVPWPITEFPASKSRVVSAYLEFFLAKARKV